MSRKAATGGARQPSDNQNVTQIRDILFGAQMEEYEARFEVLTEQFERRVAAAEKQLENRLEQFKARTDKAITELRESLASEAAERGETAVTRERLSRLLGGVADELKG